jgi:hypothetical protein
MKVKTFLSLEYFYVYNSNDVESEEYDNCCPYLSENPLIGGKILAQKGNGCTHGYENDGEPKYEHQGIEDHNLFYITGATLRGELFKAYPANKGHIGGNERQHTGGDEREQPCKKSDIDGNVLNFHLPNHARMPRSSERG